MPNEENVGYVPVVEESTEVRVSATSGMKFTYQGGKFNGQKGQSEKDVKNEASKAVSFMNAEAAQNFQDEFIKKAKDVSWGLKEKETFCEIIKDQFADEEHAGELYETARKLLKEEDEAEKYVKSTTIRYQGPVAAALADAILAKIASDERSHKILLSVLVERLCP